MPTRGPGVRARVCRRVSAPHGGEVRGREKAASNAKMERRETDPPLFKACGVVELYYCNVIL